MISWHGELLSRRIFVLLIISGNICGIVTDPNPNSGKTRPGEGT